MCSQKFPAIRYFDLVSNCSLICIVYIRNKRLKGKMFESANDGWCNIVLDWPAGQVPVLNAIKGIMQVCYIKCKMC